MPPDAKPGRELDALVAEKVMGWKIDSIGHIWWWVKPGDKSDIRPPIVCNQEASAYSTDSTAAMEVLGKLRRDGWIVDVAFNPISDVQSDRVKFGAIKIGDPIFSIRHFVADGFALGVCLLALKIKELR